MITINGYPGQTLAHTLEHLLYCLSDINTKYHSHNAVHLQLGGMRKGSEIYARYEGLGEPMKYLLSLAKIAFKDHMQDVELLPGVDQEILKRFPIKHVAKALAYRFEQPDLSLEECLEQARHFFET